MKRRIVSLLLALLIMVNLLPLSSCEKKDEEAVISRGEWIAMLGDSMGMSDYANPDSYFSDITPEDSIFPYVQSCKEWGTLQFETEGKFQPDEPATKEFMAITATLASGTVDAEGASMEDILAQATQLGLIDDGEDLSDGIQMSDAQKTTEETTRIYLESGDADVVEIDFADGVVDLSTANAGEITINGAAVTMPASMAQGLEPGAVFIVPGDPMNPFGIAKKAAGISAQGDLVVIQAEEPELDEVFDSYKVFGSGTPDMRGLQLSDGVAIGSSAANMNMATSDSQLYADNLLYSGEPTYAKKTAEGISLSFKINFTKGTMSIAPKWDDNKVTVERLIPEELRARGDIGMSPSDDLGKIFEKSNFTAQTIPLGVDENGNPRLDSNGMEKVLTVTDKFKGGYEFTGEVSLNDFYVKSGFEFKKVFGLPVGIERVVVQVNYETEINANFKGSLSEEVTIGALPVPIAGGLSVKLELVIYADLDGELEIRTELSNNTKFEYNHGNLKKVCDKGASTSIEAAVNLEIGLAPTAVLQVLGIDIIDIKIKIGANGESTATLQYGMTQKTLSDGNKETEGYTIWGQIVLETTVSLPVITLETGTKKTLASKLHITGSWSLVSKENAPLKWKPEALNHKWPLFEIEVLGEMSADVKTDDDGKDSSDFWWASDLGQLDLKEYSVMLSLNDAPYQLELDLHGADKAPEVNWSSDDPNIASVSKDGVISPKKCGFTTITASLKNDPDVYVKCTVFIDESDQSDWEFLPSDMAYRI